MSNVNEAPANDRLFNIVVLGIEKKGLAHPAKTLEGNGYRLIFEPFDTPRRLYEFDGAIVPQGIFETFNRINTGYQTYLEHNYDPDALDRRKKEAQLLEDNGGFICFLLCERFIDSHQNADYTGTDLSKHHLNYSQLYRKSTTGGRVTNFSWVRDEFRRFINLYGAWISIFTNRSSVEFEALAKTREEIVAMVIDRSSYFIPVLLPVGRPEVMEEFFQLLAEALVSTHIKIRQSLPEWIDVFDLGEESNLRTERDALLSRMEEIDTRRAKLSVFKGALAFSDDALVHSVATIFREGFGFLVDDVDEFREDLKLIDENSKPFCLCEIKGINRGLKREFINQADSHRERSGHDEGFPTLLIVNTNIKSAKSVEDKAQEIPSEQAEHARRMGILIMRTIDLLYLLHRYLTGSLTKERVIQLLTTHTGWLSVDADGEKVLP